LTVEKASDGIVTSAPFGIDCGKSCSVDLLPGTKVVLTATSMTPFFQALWGGDCVGAIDTCALTMTKALKVSVQWGPELRPKLVKVPKGSFMMGSPTGESGRGADETLHSVTLTTDFWMAESEVTQRQYQNLIGSSPSYFKEDELPVESVSWFEAVEYCNALSAKEKLTPCYQISGTTVGWVEGVKCTGYRLPTEAEWEYAARSPATTVYAGSDSPDGVAWYSTNSGSTTNAVKTKTANGRGLYDLCGNVWEWVWDWYQQSYEALPMTDPVGQSTGERRTHRGGSWRDSASFARVAQRGADLPTFRYYSVGFRFVRSSP
jgi:formylglycine-generating enzyme required for sulfatase activity